MLSTHPAQGLRPFLCPRQGSSRPSDQASLSPYLSEMKKSACRPACALLLSSATD